MFFKRKEPEEADIDITAFMNLMIVLVPVLLMTMVFNHVAILELNMPDLTGAQTASAEDNRQLEVVVRESGIEVYYPSGNLVKTIDKIAAGNSADDAEEAPETRHDFKTLSNVLQEIKRRLAAERIAKKDVLLLSEPGVTYQSLVSTMDTLRSAKTVVVAEAVDVELFPDISLGDAPKAGGKS